MMADVRMTFTSDDKDVQKSLDAMTKKMQSLADENRKLKEASKEAGKEMTGGFDSAARSIQQTIVGAISAQAVFRTLANELENVKRKQVEAANVQAGAVTPQRAALVNNGFGTSAEVQKYNQDILAMSKRTGVSPTTLYSATSSARSGAASYQDAMANLEMAVRVRPDDLAESSAVAGGIGDAANTTGISSPAANMGLIFKALSQTRAESLQFVAANIMKGAKTSVGYGGSAGEAVSLVNTLSHSLNDSTGAQAATLAPAVAKALEDAMPNLASPLEKLDQIASDPKMVEKVMKGGSFGQFEPQVKELLTSGTQANEMFRKFASEDYTQASLEKLTEQQIAVMNSDPQQASANRARGLASGKERLQLQNLTSGDFGKIRQGVAGLLAEAPVNKFGLDYLQDSAAMARFGTPFAGGTPEKQAQEILVGRMQAYMEQNREQSPESMAVVEELKRAVAVLEKVASATEETKKNTEATKENTRGKLNIDANAE